MIQIRIVYINSVSLLFDKTYHLKENSTVQDALYQCELFKIHPEAINATFAIFSKRVTLSTVLKEGDRLEVLRPLLQNPKERRRQKAKEKGRRLTG